MSQHRLRPALRSVSVGLLSAALALPVGGAVADVPPSSSHASRPSSAGALAPADGVRRAVFVGNNWDGTADVVAPGDVQAPGPHQHRAGQGRADGGDLVQPGQAGLLPRRSGRRSARATTSSSTTCSLSPDGTRLVVSRPSFADVVAIDLRTAQDRLALPGDGLPRRPHGDLAGRQRLLVSASTANKVARARHRDRQDRRQLRVRRPAAREQLHRATAS